MNTQNKHNTVETQLRKARFSVDPAFRSALHTRFVSQAAEHAAAAPSRNPFKTFLAVMSVPATVALVAAVVFIWNGQNRITDTITDTLAPKALLAASIERSFGATDTNTFRYQKFILATEGSISEHDRWQHEDSKRDDFYSLVKSSALNYQSVLTTTDSLCLFGISQNNPTAEFMTTQRVSCGTNASVQAQDPGKTDAYLNVLKESIDTLGEPIETVSDTYQGYAALRSTYALSQEQAVHLPYLSHNTSPVTVTFVLLTEQHQVVSVTYKNAETNGTLMQFTVAEDYVITDKNPYTFLKQSSWESAMQSAQTDAAAFVGASAAYALPIQTQHFTEEQGDTTIFTSTLYPLSLSIPAEGWEIETDTSANNTSLIGKFVHPDPVEGTRESEIGFPKEASVYVWVWEKGTDNYTYLSGLLSQSTPRTYEESQMGPIERDASEETVTIDGVSGKRYNITSTSEYNTTVNIETVLQVDANNIIQMAGIVYSDDEGIQDEIRSIEDSLRIAE